MEDACWPDLNLREEVPVPLTPTMKENNYPAKYVHVYITEEEIAK